MNITIHRRCRDIDGAMLVQLIARANERRSKEPLLANQEVDRPEKTSRWPWILIGLVASYFSIHITIAMIKAALQ